MRTRTVVLTIVAMTAVGTCIGPAAIGASTSGTKGKISELQKVGVVAVVGTPTATALRQVFAGTLNGKLAGKSIRGALRGIAVTNLRARAETVTGTEYDAAGSRKFKIRVHLSFSSSRVTDRGTGEWTGGTDAYTAARGNFHISGGGPITGVSKIRLIGDILH
jgi:hypothetical protein